MKLKLSIQGVFSLDDHKFLKFTDGSCNLGNHFSSFHALRALCPGSLDEPLSRITTRSKSRITGPKI
jgi:hypothetical protein